MLLVFQQWGDMLGGVGWIYYLWRTSDFFRGLNAFFFLCLHIIRLIIA